MMTRYGMFWTISPDGFSSIPRYVHLTKWYGPMIFSAGWEECYHTLLASVTSQKLLWATNSLEGSPL